VGDSLVLSLASGSLRDSWTGSAWGELVGLGRVAHGQQGADSDGKDEDGDDDDHQDFHSTLLLGRPASRAGAWL
jgi:hypothetical protein